MNARRSHLATFALIVMVVAASCSRPAPKPEGPADPSAFSLTIRVQNTTLGPAVSSTLASTPPWTQLRHRTHTGEQAAAWLPGALLAEVFELEPARIGVVPQPVFSIFLVYRADWDSLRLAKATGDLDEVLRAGGCAVLYRAPRANPYAAGSSDAATWERLRLSVADARRRITLELRDSDGSLASVDTTGGAAFAPDSVAAH